MKKFSFRPRKVYVPIRQSDRFLPISVFNPYTDGLCQSRVVSDYQSDLPQFNPRLLLYMPSSLLRLDILMQIVCFLSRYCGLRPKRKGSTPDTMPTPISTGYRRTHHLPKLQCSLYATACIVARPTVLAPFGFNQGTGYFYFRACP